MLLMDSNVRFERHTCARLEDEVISIRMSKLNGWQQKKP